MRWKEMWNFLNHFQDWKKRCKPNMTMPIPKGTSVEAMAVVEDFIYLNCSRSPSIIQVTWIFFLFSMSATLIYGKEKGMIIPLLEHNILPEGLYLITNFSLTRWNLLASPLRSHAWYLMELTFRSHYHLSRTRNKNSYVSRRPSIVSFYLVKV